MYCLVVWQVLCQYQLLVCLAFQGFFLLSLVLISHLHCWKLYLSYNVQKDLPFQHKLSKSSSLRIPFPMYSSAIQSSTVFLPQLLNPVAMPWGNLFFNSCCVIECYVSLFLTSLYTVKPNLSYLHDSY